MTPRELALELLRHRFRTPAGDAAHLDALAGFQRAAVPRLEDALARYGGALLADSVGLGKTHVGAAVVRRAAARGERAALIVPTSLRRQWRRALRGTTGVLVATHAELSRGGRAVLERASLLVVDEAHAFRNPRTYRYAALARLAVGRRSLLITATPVNNSLRDLYWLLRLFAADDAFGAIGVNDLAGCVRDAERTGRYAPLSAVLAEVAVRRTREQVAHASGSTLVPSATAAPASALHLRFPARAPPLEIPYPVPTTLQRELLRSIEQLELAPWSVPGRPAGALLLRLVLLKRLESSRAAFMASAERLLRVLRAFRDALGTGHLLTPAEQRLRAAGDADQLALDPLVLQPLPPALDAAALRRAADADCARLEWALRQLASPDPKLLRLRELVHGELSGRPLLVFTECRDTAHAIWRELHASLPTALIHGGGAWLGLTPVPRRLVVERFAPAANGAAPPPERERPRVLIATDVLAEGLNLQDAAELVSYDLPWNPVRLLQRMGRIDRLGSPHALVRGYYFSPDAGLEAMLRLLRRLRTKLAAIRGSVGEEAAVLAGGRQPGMQPSRRASAKPAAADRLFETGERLRALLLRAEAAADPMAGLPLAGAASARPERRRCPAAPILELPRPMLTAGAHAILFFEQRGLQRAVCLGSRAFEDATATAALLEAAVMLHDPAACVVAPESRELVARARAHLVRPPPAPRRPPHVRVLRQRLLNLLGTRPGGATPAECGRVERLLAALRRPLSIAQELALSRIRGAAQFDQLTAAVGAALELDRGTQPVEPLQPSGAEPAAEPLFLGGFRDP